MKNKFSFYKEGRILERMKGWIKIALGRATVGFTVTTMAVVLGGCLLTACPRCRTAPEVLPVDTVRTAVLVFAGDVMQHSQQVRAAQQADGTYSYDAVFQYVKPIFEGADLAVVNLETTLAPAPPYTGYPQFRSPIALAEGLARAGVEVALMANNHICDNGALGIRTTIAALDSVGVRHTGAYADGQRTMLRIVRKGFDIRLLNYTYATNGLPVPRGMAVNLIDTMLIASDLAAIERNDSTVVIACLHWGEEYQTKPSKQQVELAEWLHERGVNIIVGSHPHVVQPIDYEANTIYSLGNFVSAQRKPNTDKGLMARITLTRTPNTPLSIAIEPIKTEVRLPDYVIVVNANNAH